MPCLRPGLYVYVRCYDVLGHATNGIKPEQDGVSPMFVYLDESGDTGFKFKQKSSRYFVITLVVVEDPFFINEAVDKLREHLGYDYDPEFHFFSTKPEIREQFLFAIRDLDFVVRALVIDKQRLPSPQMRKREAFYNSFVRLLLQHDNGTIDDAILVLDASVKSKRIQAQGCCKVRQR